VAKDGYENKIISVPATLIFRNKYDTINFNDGYDTTRILAMKKVGNKLRYTAKKKEEE